MGRPRRPRRRRCGAGGASLIFFRHSRESGKSRATTKTRPWIPAFAGMTGGGLLLPEGRDPLHQPLPGLPLVGAGRLVDRDRQVGDLRSIFSGGSTLAGTRIAASTTAAWAQVEAAEGGVGRLHARPGNGSAAVRDAPPPAGRRARHGPAPRPDGRRGSWPPAGSASRAGPSGSRRRSARHRCNWRRHKDWRAEFSRVWEGRKGAITKPPGSTMSPMGAIWTLPSRAWVVTIVSRIMAFRGS